MAETLTLNLYDGASLETSTDRQRYVQRGLVEGIDVGGGNKIEALFNAQTLIANTLGDTLEGHSDLPLTRIFLRPVTDTAAYADIVWETPTIGGGPPSTYLLRNGAYLSEYETNKMPGTREPIRVDWTDPDDSDNKVPEDLVVMRFMRPIRIIAINALVYGTPSTVGQDNVGSVNNAPWPGSTVWPPAWQTSSPSFTAYPKGYWRLDKFQTDFAKYGGYFTIDAVAATKTSEDWSETGTLRHQQTQRFVKVADADLTSLLTPEYSFGIEKVNGAVRVGPHPLISFSSIFGF